MSLSKDTYVPVSEHILDLLDYFDYTNCFPSSLRKNKFKFVSI